MPGDVLAAVAAAVGLREGRHGVEEVLRHLSARGPAGSRALSRLTGLPVPVVAAVCAELRAAGLLTRERPSRLGPAGMALAGQLGWGGDVGGAASCACEACGGSGIALPAALEALRSDVAVAVLGAPPADTRLDQAHCTVESKLRRAAYLLDSGALSGRAVLLLGDDDLLGLTLQLVAGAVGGPPRRLVALDVDPAVVAFDGSASAGVAVERVVHDLRRPLPAALVGAFDTVVTDPPYTLAGAELFLSRAASALRPGAGGQVLLCFGPKPPQETAAVQRMVTAMGFAVHRLVRNFNEYAGASVLGGTSHLYHLVGGDVLAPSVIGDYEGPLYTGDLRRPGRVYTCRGCRTRLVVGTTERWPTIGDLRRAGCPRCGGGVFVPGGLPPRGGGRSARTGRGAG